MGKTITKNNVTTTTVTVDKVGLWIVIITVIIIVIVVITGISVRFALSDEHLSSIILISLICFLVLLGIVVLTILAARRKKFAKTETKLITLSANLHDPINWSIL
ncbi:hypothetical protein JTB14_002386 [Gonioctena quinquepunctata]|nr:hypothetical protein JTB14_002386 [Gonioctena quinquepunctata]